MQDQPGDALRQARGVLERHRRAQADPADIVPIDPQAIDECLKKFGVPAHGEWRLAGGRLAAARQVGNDDAPVSGKGRSPGMEILQRADEPVTQEQRVARSLVEVPDPPLPDVDVLDVRRDDRGGYSPVSICARCKRPL